MVNIRALFVFAAVAVLGVSAMPSHSNDKGRVERLDWPPRAGPLSIMSYNIKGLPWPVASGRGEAIGAIGQRLAALRSSGNQPHIVLLQEAFGNYAQVLGETAGYRFVVSGPQASASQPTQPLGQAFADGAQWIKGEESGTLTGSGLAILSDYPVVRTERYAFPAGACAGYDCLSAKGVLVAWIDVPGAGEPIAIVDTHLNSRNSTHVAVERADRAFTWQAAAVRRILASDLPPDAPVILGGDFNTGHVPRRIAAVSLPLIEGAQRDGLGSVLARGGVTSGSQGEAQLIVRRNKDRILFRDGARVALRPEQAWVPFALYSERPLSDHAGFVVDYALER